MENANKHWTETSVPKFIYRIGSDFISQIEEQLDNGPLKQKDLARNLGCTEGYVSQVLKKPGNLQLETMVKYARALEMKVSVVLYDDNDPQNQEGPIHSDVFRKCWEISGKPRDFWALAKRESIPMTLQESVELNDSPSNKWIHFEDTNLRVQAGGGS